MKMSLSLFEKATNIIAGQLKMEGVLIEKPVILNGLINAIKSPNNLYNLSASKEGPFIHLVFNPETGDVSMEVKDKPQKDPLDVCEQKLIKWLGAFPPSYFLNASLKGLLKTAKDKPFIEVKIKGPRLTTISATFDNCIGQFEIYIGEKRENSPILMIPLLPEESVTVSDEPDYQPTALINKIDKSMQARGVEVSWNYLAEAISYITKNPGQSKVFVVDECSILLLYDGFEDNYAVILKWLDKRTANLTFVL